MFAPSGPTAWPGVSFGSSVGIRVLSSARPVVKAAAGVIWNRYWNGAQSEYQSSGDTRMKKRLTPTGVV
jgi:hypothetical protein